MRKASPHKVSPRFDDAVRLLAVLGAAVKLEQPLVLLRLLPRVVGVDVPHAEGLSEVLERDVGPYPNGDLTVMNKQDRSNGERYHSSWTRLTPRVAHQGGPHVILGATGAGAGAGAAAAAGAGGDGAAKLFSFDRAPVSFSAAGKEKIYRQGRLGKRLLIEEDKKMLGKASLAGRHQLRTRPPWGPRGG